MEGLEDHPGAGIGHLQSRGLWGLGDETYVRGSQLPLPATSGGTGGFEASSRSNEHNGSFRRWCLERGLARTTSCPDEHAQNGRAEAAINSIKQRARRLLHGAEMEVRWWPVAARHVVELERRCRESRRDMLF